jgi:hypothetical protein
MGRFKTSQPPNKGQRIQGPALRPDARNPDKFPPKFSFHYLQRGYCITSCTQEEQLAFVDRMYRLSQLSWAELRRAPRHGLGYEQIARASIRAGIPANITGDVNFIAFRFYGKAAMVGYRSDDGTFHIIWFDREFKLYEHA